MMSSMSLPAAQSISKKRMAGTKPHVGIVGAGISGLACARVLLDHGVRVTILEARSRLGGRLCQSSLLGHDVDLGPNWLHGAQNNPLMEIAEKTGTVAIEMEPLNAVLDEDGTRLSEGEAVRLFGVAWGVLDDAFKHSRSNSDAIPATESLWDFLLAKVEKTDLTEKEKKVVCQMAEIWGCYVGSPIQRQSLKFFWLEDVIDGENLWVASTYKKIVDYIVALVASRATIQLDHEAVQIDYSSPESVSVDEKQGLSQRFDEVVVTTPLGWLKRNQKCFKPELPPRISQAIESLSYGTLEKCWIRFPKAFWHQADADGTTGAETMFLSPQYAESNPEHWLQTIISYAALPAPHNYPTILFYIEGPCSKYITDTITNLNQGSAEYNAFLDAFFRPYYTRLPGFDASAADCQPQAFLATNWQNDPFAGFGSYSNYQVGLEAGDRDIEAIRKGLGEEQGLWFAGEHTAPFIASGTVAGALWSGEAVAQRILNVYELGDGDAGLTAELVQEECPELPPSAHMLRE